MAFHFQPDPGWRHESVYTQIKHALLAYARSRGFAYGDAMPSVYEVAEAAGVSIRTADRALLALVEEGHCFRRPKRGTFFSGDRGGRRLLLGLSSSSAVAIEDSPTSMALHQGILAACKEMGAELFMLQPPLAESLRFYQRLQAFDFRGVLGIDPTGFSAIAELAAAFPELRMAFLNYRAVDMRETPPNLHLVFNDDAGGARQMVARFAALGCRRFCVLNLALPPENGGYATLKARADGFAAAAAAFGMGFDPRRDLLEAPCGERLAEIRAKGAEMLAAYWGGGGRPDAVVATVYSLAEGAAAQLRRADLASSVRVGGYDMAEPMDRFLPAVEVDYARMGRVAVERALGRGEAPNLSEIPCLLVNTGAEQPVALAT